MKDKKEETKLITITAQECRRLKLGLAERMKVRRRRERERRNHFYK